jgi:hypothetical protein
MMPENTRGPQIITYSGHSFVVYDNLFHVALATFAKAPFKVQKRGGSRAPFQPPTPKPQFDMT